MTSTAFLADGWRKPTAFDQFEQLLREVLHKEFEDEDRFRVTNPPLPLFRGRTFRVKKKFAVNAGAERRRSLL